MTGLFKTIKRNGKTFYRVGKSTVCYVAPWGGEKWAFLIGSPSAYSNMVVLCDTEREAHTRALTCVHENLELRAQIVRNILAARG